MNKRNGIILFVSLLIILFFCATYISNANSETSISPDARTYFYKIDSDYFTKSRQNIGLVIVDYMEVELNWNEINESYIIKGKLNFPYISNDLAMVIMTDFEYIAQGGWVLEDNNDLYVYFYEEDLNYFREKEIVYIVLLEFENGLYFDVY